MPLTIPRPTPEILEQAERLAQGADLLNDLRAAREPRAKKAEPPPAVTMTELHAFIRRRCVGRDERVQRAIRFNKRVRDMYNGMLGSFALATAPLRAAAAGEESEVRTFEACDGGTITIEVTPSEAEPGYSYLSIAHSDPKAEFVIGNLQFAVEDEDKAERYGEEGLGPLDIEPPMQGEVELMLPSDDVRLKAILDSRVQVHFLPAAP